MKQVASIHSDDEVLVRVQSEIKRALNPALKCPLLDGVLVTANLKAAGATAVSHKLPRKPLGFINAGQNANAVIWESAARTNNILTLSTSADVTVTLWVF